MLLEVSCIISHQLSPLERRVVVCLTLCYFVLVFFSPFSITITSLGEERASLSAFRTFDRFVLVWICRFSLPLDVWEGLRFVIVALPGLFSYLFRDIQIVIVTKFVVVLSVGIKRVDCYTTMYKTKQKPKKALQRTATRSHKNKQPP